MMIAAVISGTGVRPLQHLKAFDEQNPGVFGDALGGQGVSAAGGNTGVAEGTTHSLTVAGAWVVSPNFVAGQPGRLPRRLGMSEFELVARAFSPAAATSGRRAAQCKRTSARRPALPAGGPRHESKAAK